MTPADDMRRCLEDGDVAGARNIWARVAPHLPQPKTHGDAEIVLHRARTETSSVTLPKRAYSHRWLSDRGYQSGLPDELKPKAERLYPRVVSAVGISVNARSELMKPVVPLIRAAMEDAVLEADADGKLTDDRHVRHRMLEARQNVIKKMVGRLVE